MECESNRRIETARTGLPTLIVEGKALHSRFDPEKEAQRTAASVPQDADIVVLAGFGLGYVAQALTQSRPNRRLIVAEADEGLPSWVATVRDLSGFFSNPLVSILAGGNPQDVRGLLAGGPTGSKIHFLLWKPSLEGNPQWYRTLQDAVKETIRRRKINAYTLERFGRLWVRNLASNSRILHRALSLDDCNDQFAGIPALVLAGGPSLEIVLPHLKVLAERHLMIAVDTAVPALLRAGVQPDAVAAVDPQYWNTRHLDRCGPGCLDALVLGETATHPVVFRTLQGRPLLTRTRFPLGTLLEDAAGIRGELQAGGSVATAAWDLARHLGCSPMTVAGLDLGFPGRRTHYAGSLSRERPHLFSHRTAPGENVFFHALRDAAPRPVEDMEGGWVLSDERMDVYASWFAENLSGLKDRCPAVVGTKGRKIPGMNVVSLLELQDRPVRRRQIDAILTKIKAITPGPGIPEKVSKSLGNMQAALTQLENIAAKGAALAEEARRWTSLKNGPSKLFAQLENIDNQILSIQGRDIVSFLIQPIIQEIAGEKSPSENPLETSTRLYSQIAESAAYHRRILALSSLPKKDVKN